MTAPERRPPTVPQRILGVLSAVLGAFMLAWPLTTGLASMPTQISARTGTYAVVHPLAFWLGSMCFGLALIGYGVEVVRRGPDLVPGRVTLAIYLALGAGALLLGLALLGGGNGVRLLPLLALVLGLGSLYAAVKVIRAARD